MAFEKLPKFKFSDIINKVVIGKGAYGCVFKAEYVESYQQAPKLVAVKQLPGEDVRDQLLFGKEASLLHACNHRNILKFLAVCQHPLCIMTDYEEFSFSSWGKEKKVHALHEFIAYLHCEFQMKGFEKYSVECASQLAQGIQYLHDNNIVHRDIKPKNVLVSNMNGSIVIKIADFGESRAQDIQTNQRSHQHTINLGRGTTLYMAPELFIPSLELERASLEDLKRADVWSFGMVLYNLLNPNIKYPFEKEYLQFGNKSFDATVRTVLGQRKKPAFDDHYEMLQYQQAFPLKELYTCCTDFIPDERPTASNIATALSSEKEQDCINIHLNVSQNSACEENDLCFARGFTVTSQVPNDGRNACSFLSIATIARILKSSFDQYDACQSLGNVISPLAEEQILSVPGLIKNARDMARLYDPFEAYTILVEQHVLEDKFHLQELILKDKVSLVLSAKGKQEFLNAMSSLCDGENHCGAYTYGMYTMVICALNNKLVLIDPHPIPTELGGNRNGIIKVYPHDNKDVHLSVWRWIKRRLTKSGIKEQQSNQSFVLVTVPNE